MAVKYGAATTPKDVGMGHSVSAYLVNFVKTGDPNGSDLPKWERYTAAEDQIMDFTMEGVAKPGKDAWGLQLDIARLYLDRRP